jgi:hypothetical protein
MAARSSESVAGPCTELIRHILEASVNCGGMASAGVEPELRRARDSAWKASRRRTRTPTASRRLRRQAGDSVRWPAGDSDGEPATHHTLLQVHPLAPASDSVTFAGQCNVINHQVALHWGESATHLTDSVGAGLQCGCTSNSIQLTVFNLVRVSVPSSRDSHVCVSLRQVCQ